MSERPYSRVYWSIVDDPDFESVFGNDAALATWLRLLIVADGTWPATAPLPRNVRAAPLKLLVDHGLISILPGDRYRVKGLDAERQRRSSQASASATLRWQTPRREGGKVVSRGMRFKVLERDGFACRYCGGKAPDVVLDVDHLVPVREGGTDDLNNLVAACVDCNSGKSGHPLRAQPLPDARASKRASDSGMLAEPRQDKTRQEEKSKEGTSSGVTGRTTFMGFRQKPSLPAEAVPVHDGRHGRTCFGCFPPLPEPAT